MCERKRKCTKQPYSQSLESDAVSFLPATTRDIWFSWYRDGDAIVGPISLSQVRHSRRHSLRTKYCSRRYRYWPQNALQKFRVIYRVPTKRRLSDNSRLSEVMVEETPLVSPQQRSGKRPTKSLIVLRSIIQFQSKAKINEISAFSPQRERFRFACHGERARFPM